MRWTDSTLLCQQAGLLRKLRRFPSLCAALLVMLLPPALQSTPSNDWSDPEVIEHVTAVSYPVSIDVDSGGQVHLVYVRDADGDGVGDSLFYTCRSLEGWRASVGYGSDTLGMGPASILLDHMKRPHILWSEGFPHFAPFHMMRLLHGMIAAGAWPTEPDTIVQRAPPAYPDEAMVLPDYRAAVLPDNTLLFSWMQDEGWDFWFGALDSQGRISSWQPFPSFRWDAGGMSYKPHLSVGPSDSLHLVFIGSPTRDSSDRFGVYYATKHFAAKQWLGPRLIPQSADPLPIRCRVAVSPHGVRYVFWLVWKTPGVFQAMDIYRSFALDGLGWSMPADVTQMEQILGLNRVLMDPEGNWHAVFTRSLLGSRGQLFYVWGFRNGWSEPVSLYEWQGGEDFAIDRRGRIHLVWVSSTNTRSSVDQRDTLFYAWRDLPITSELDTPITISPDVKSPDPLVFPNPFNDSCRFLGHLPSTSLLSVRIYDIMGRRVKILKDSIPIEGEYSITWDGKDDRGLRVGAGLYLYLITIRPTDNDEQKRIFGKIVVLQ